MATADFDGTVTKAVCSTVEENHNKQQGHSPMVWTKDPSLRCWTGGSKRNRYRDTTLNPDFVHDSAYVLGSSWQPNVDELEDTVTKPRLNGETYCNLAIRRKNAAQYK
jgi:hypothetical protein